MRHVMCEEKKEIQGKYHLLWTMFVILFSVKLFM